MELLGVMLHDQITISANIRRLTASSSCIKRLNRLLYLIVETCEPIVLLVRLITLLKVVYNQLKTLD